ncbi:hypothetical protein M0R72_00245 [Candidatus Pacearchaeota archaeon]|jgi:hypothetical protein|nr:hypothetical protein [Candidatus Pacearchaeota archaeon]
MNLQILLLQTILVVAPPGHSAFSVVPVECGDSCSEYKWSTFYNSYVKKESVEEGKTRYEVIIGSIIKTAQKKLCLDDSLNKISDCTRSKAFRGWTFVDLVSVVSASMIAESGLREDVEVGRGRSGHTKKNDPLTDDAGGQGRGPGGEVCLVQIHPLVLAKFKIDPETFLGTSEEALENCFSFGMDMFSRSRNMCSWQASKTPTLKHDWVFEMFSAYGTGSTCESANNGKTPYRRGLYTSISSDFGSRVKKALRKEKRAEEKASRANELVAAGN